MTFPWPWPPYGVFPGRYRELGDGEDDVMLDWQPGEEEAKRLASFKAWRDKELELIADHLWPIYDRDTRDWEGGARAFAVDATAAELDIMINAYQGAHRTLDETPSTPLQQQGIGDHLYHFKIEDTPRETPSGANLSQYDGTLSYEEHANAVKVIAAAFSVNGGVGRKVSGLFWTKTKLVRPRPSQAAMLVNKDHFKCEIATTSFHSSIMSGHCVQGILLGCAVMENWLSAGREIPDEQKRSLAQYSVDWGDRRVFAGVHYPTDNICSWGLAIEIIPHIYRHAQIILEFARDAIMDQSRVYRTIKHEFPNHPPLEHAIQYLKEKDLWDDEQA